MTLDECRDWLLEKEEEAETSLEFYADKPGKDPERLLFEARRELDIIETLLDFIKEHNDEGR